MIAKRTDLIKQNCSYRIRGLIVVVVSRPLALDHFLRQLCAPQISLAVRQRKPKCVKEAVDVTLEVESYLFSINRDYRASQDENAISANASSETPIQQLESMVEALHNLQLRLANLEAAIQYPKQSQLEDKSDHTTICYRCKQPGHFARGCAFNSRKQWRRELPSSKGQTLPALSVNSVTSYYLQGNVSDVVVSFLVDIGAGV